MAAGPSAFGFVYFVGIKMLGYSGVAAGINSLQARSNPGDVRPNAWKVGAARTGIGLAFGIAVGFGFFKIVHTDQSWPFFVGLIPVRLVEWSLLLWLFYRHALFSPGKKAAIVAGGSAVSFGLDLLGIVAAFVLPGGAWVC